jgi:osmotically-inducible protein OsmY
VPDAETRDLAGETVAHIPGIDRVENLLLIGPGTLDTDNLAARKIRLHLWSLSQINPGPLRIAVFGGVTTLAGLCRDSAQRRLVETGVRLFTGQEVINEIVVSPGPNYPELPGIIDDVSVTALSYRALRRIGLGIDQGTVVRTRDGMVMINGSVPSDSVRQQATALIRELRGAQTVVNNLRVQR